MVADCPLNLRFAYARLNDVTTEESIMFKGKDMGTLSIVFVFGCVDSKQAYTNFEILFMFLLYVMMQSVSHTVWDETVR